MENAMNSRIRVKFDLVRAATDFSLVLAHYGVAIDPSRAQNTARCPMPGHDDKHASFSVNTDKRNFQCFACKRMGNVLDFVTYMEGGDKDNVTDLATGALKALEIMGLDPEDYKYKGSRSDGAKSPQSKSNKPALKTKVEPDAEDDLTPAESNKPLENLLDLNPDHPFFVAHGIAPEIVEFYGLGYCARGVMKGRICIPLRDATGNIIGYSGRWPDEEVPENQPRYKLPKADWGFRKSHMLYNLDRAIGKQSRHVVIVEGFWSAMRLDQLSIPVVALMGTSIGDAQVALLSEHGFTYATVIMDGDQQGQKAAGDIVISISQKLYVRQLSLPDGQKPDTMNTEWLERIS